MKKEDLRYVICNFSCLFWALLVNLYVYELNIAEQRISS